MGRRLALLIATYEFEDPGLRRLTAPGHDAEQLAEVLRDPEIAGFEVTTLINEPHHRVGVAIGDLYRNRRRDDLTLLYFTGHGLKDDRGRLYLATLNTRRDSLMFTSLPAEQIEQAMSGCMSRQQVLILDCCYSGAFPAGVVAKSDTEVHALERFQGRGRTVLTASDAAQYSFEGQELTGSATHSVFTRHLVAGLRDGSADLDGDGDITLDELYSYVHDRVVDEMPQQRPKKQDDVEGRIVIARNINWRLPSHLAHALRSPMPSDRLAAVEGMAHLYLIGNQQVRAQAGTHLEALAEDDSRKVAQAAAAQLARLTGRTPAIAHSPVAQPPVAYPPVVAPPVAAPPPPVAAPPVAHLPVAAPPPPVGAPSPGAPLRPGHRRRALTAAAVLAGAGVAAWAIVGSGVWDDGDPARSAPQAQNANPNPNPSESPLELWANETKKVIAVYADADPVDLDKPWELRGTDKAEISLSGRYKLLATPDAVLDSWPTEPSPEMCNLPSEVPKTGKEFDLVPDEYFCVLTSGNNALLGQYQKTTKDQQGREYAEMFFWRPPDK